MLNFIKKLFRLDRNYRIIRIGHNVSYAVPRDQWPELLGKRECRT